MTEEIRRGHECSGSWRKGRWWGHRGRVGWSVARHGSADELFCLVVLGSARRLGTAREGSLGTEGKRNEAVRNERCSGREGCEVSPERVGWKHDVPCILCESCRCNHASTLLNLLLEC